MVIGGKQGITALTFIPPHQCLLVWRERRGSVADQSWAGEDTSSSVPPTGNIPLGTTGKHPIDGSSMENPAPTPGYYQEGLAGFWPCRRLPTACSLSVCCWVITPLLIFSEERERDQQADIILKDPINAKQLTLQVAPHLGKCVELQFTVLGCMVNQPVKTRICRFLFLVPTSFVTSPFIGAFVSLIKRAFKT